MKRLLLLLPFLFPLLLTAQVPQRYEVQVVAAEAPFIRYGDFYYENNYRGLRQLMRELPAYDPSLYRQLQPQWEQMQTRQTLGVVVLSAGLTVGGIVMASRPQEDYQVGFGSFTSTASRTDYDKAIRNIYAGATIMAVLGVAGALIVNRRPQVLGFINAFNHNSTGPKLRFSMSTAVGPGVGLHYRLD